MSRGLTNREIAAELFVTPETVKTHLKRLGDKLGERRRAGMVSCASRLGLLSVTPLAVAVPL
jgi:DNA-binding NarL/FixJ family response regulator